MDLREAMLAKYVRDQLKSRLIGDHSRLRNILEDVAQLAHRGSFVTAGRCFGEFRIAEERALNLEENTLFLVIERLSGPNEAIQRARTNHLAIRRLMNAVGVSLSTSRVREFIDAHRQLLGVVREHWECEERLLSQELKNPGNEAVEEIESAMLRF